MEVGIQTSVLNDVVSVGIKTCLSDLRALEGNMVLAGYQIHPRVQAEKRGKIVGSSVRLPRLVEDTARIMPFCSNMGKNFAERNT